MPRCSVEAGLTGVNPEVRTQLGAPNVVPRIGIVHTHIHYITLHYITLYYITLHTCIYIYIYILYICTYIYIHIRSYIYKYVVC